MGVFSSFLERFGYYKPSKGTVARLIERGLAEHPLTPFNDVKRFADEGFRRNVLVFACVKLRGRSAAQIKFVAKKETEGELEALKPNHPLQRLLARPNAEQSQMEFIQHAWLHKDVGGAKYIHKVRARAGNIVELWLLRPDRVQPVPDTQGFVMSYEFPTDQALRMRIPAEDVVYLPERDYLDDYYGLSKIAVLARQGDVDNESSEYMRSVLLNAGVPAAGLKIKTDYQLTTEHKRAMQESWRDNYGRASRMPGWAAWTNSSAATEMGTGGFGRLAIFDADVEFIRMGSAFNEMDLNGIFAHTESRICSAFGVPPILIGAKAGLDAGTYSNAEQAEDNFWNQTMVPEAWEFANKLSNEVAPEFGEGLVIEPDFGQIRALREDQDARATRASVAWNDGVITFDEYRIDLGKEAATDDGAEVNGEPITDLGKKYKWQLSLAKEVPPVLEEEDTNEPGEGDENEERDSEAAPEEKEEEEPEEEEFNERLRMLLAGIAPWERLAKRPAYRRLHDAADLKSLSIRRCISKGFRLAKEGIEVQSLANALFVKDSMKAEELALRAFRENGVPVIKKTMCSAIGSLYRSGAKAGVRDTRAKQAIGPREKFAGPSLDPGEDESFAETRVAELVTDVSEATRTIIRSHVEGMFNDGYSARRAATRIRDTIGLTKQGLRRLQKYEEAQIAKGVTGDELNSRLSRFSRKLIRERALTIARTEGIRAVSEGQSSIWKQATEMGILPQDQEMFWITTEDERTCEICAPMDGQTIKVGETFSTGDGGSVDAPPAHPNCRCARGLK